VLPTTSGPAPISASLLTLTAIYGVNVRTGAQNGPPPDVDGTSNVPSPPQCAVNDAPALVALPSACPSKRRYTLTATARTRRTPGNERHQRFVTVVSTAQASSVVSIPMPAAIGPTSAAPIGWKASEPSQS
jgi:hypothetical protein